MAVAVKINLPETERGQSPEALARFDKAKRALQNPMTKPRARADHERALAAIEDAPKVAADTAWRAQANAETIALAKARGEEVETTKAGRINIRTRDSLVNLINAGKFTPAQAQAAKDCRDAYELRAQSLGAMNYSDTGRGGKDHEAAIAWGIRKATATAMIGHVERAIAVNCTKDPNALTMFRAILERQMAVNDFGDSESVRTRNVESLILAVEAAIAGMDAWRKWLRERTGAKDNMC